jgi:hypothetical protein
MAIPPPLPVLKCGNFGVRMRRTPELPQLARLDVATIGPDKAREPQ